jgi:DNA-binding XRE family transcriptional regulator
MQQLSSLRSHSPVGVVQLWIVRHRSRIVTITAPHIRFREAREHLGLSPDELATRSDVSQAGVWDIEAFEGDLTCCYSPSDVQKFCRVLGIRPVELFGADISEPAVSAGELVRLIRDECHSRGVTLEQFEDAVGWRLSACIEPPERLLEDMTVDGLQWLCRELHIDWRRVFLSYDHDA